MRDRPLENVGAWLLRAPREGARGGGGQAAGALGIDPALAGAFTDGTLGPAGESALAFQVARALPVHAALPVPAAAELTRITGHLGGPSALIGWLDRHPGPPRLAARLCVLVALLDRYSAEPAVVSELRAHRERVPYPPELDGHLAPGTDEDTLAGLARQIESLLGEGRSDDAVKLAVATVSMCLDVAPRAAEADPGVRDLGATLDEARQDVLAEAYESA
ncbi:hypothetical protein ACFV6E_26655 [Streptomyces sp. NPDC059785]|uniref:hypothetical protein n=1 Tax=unclassified Streptomyces TaxID=2593676 RepID=UPI003653AE95